MSPNSYIPNEANVYISPKQLKKLSLFWIGFIVYAYGAALTSTAIASSTYVISQGIQLIGIVLFVSSISGFIKTKFDNQYLAFLFPIYFVWQIITIARGFQTDFNFIKQMLFDSGFGMFSYLASIILLFPRNLAFYKKLFNVILITNILFLGFSFYYLRDLLNADRTSILSQAIVESFVGILAFQAGFILLTYAYHSPKRRIFALSIILIALLFATYRARRGLMFMCISTLACYFLTYLISTKKKILIIYTSVFLALITIFYVSSMYTQNESGLFGFLMERGDEDTRSGVEEFMIADMSDTDWVIGKGVNGEYYCPNIDQNSISDYRSVIESGYLEIMLKGGAISLVLYLLIGIPAIFLGLFYSKNILSQASALWILLSTIYIYPIVVTSFDLRYLIYWIAIGICYSSKIRKMPDSYIKKYFLEEDKISKELFF